MISIIIPTYNSAKYIKKCLQSVCAQTNNNYEIIIVDDGSTDGTQKIIKNINNPQIRFFETNHKGVSSARNIGIDKARGNYIMFVDSDDTIELKTIENYSNIINYFPYDIVLGKFKTIIDKGFTREFLDGEYAAIAFNHLKHEDKFKFFVDKGIQTCLVTRYLFNRQLIIKNKIYFCDALLHEDEEWTPRALLYAKSIMATDYVHYNYFLRSDSLSMDANQSKYKSLLFIYLKLAKLAMKKNLSHQKKLFLIKRCRIIIKILFNRIQYVNRETLSILKSIAKENQSSIDFISNVTDNKSVIDFCFSLIE